MSSLTIHDVVSSISVDALENHVSESIHGLPGFVRSKLKDEKTMDEWIKDEQSKLRPIGESVPDLSEEAYGEYIENLRWHNQVKSEKRYFHLSITNMVVKETGTPRVIFAFSIETADYSSFKVNRFREIPTAVLANIFASSCASLTSSELKNSHEIKGQVTNFDFQRIKDEDFYLGKVQLFLERTSV